jgi:hypothetical protein
MSVNPFNKLLLIVLTVLAVGTGVAIAAGTNGGSSSDPTTTVVDVNGPCDEAEHANDPECAGAQVPEDNDADDQGDDRGRGPDHAEDEGVVDDDQGEDLSGPCDEAEHANDPRCTGAGGAGDDDQGEVEDRGDDNSGPSANSGPGSSHDDADDNSGHGGGDDDGGNSGPGGGDDD